MSSFIIEGGHRLKGEITPQGAKNEALQVICATLLTEEEVIKSIEQAVDYAMKSPFPEPEELYTDLYV